MNNYILKSMRNEKNSMSIHISVAKRMIKKEVYGERKIKSTFIDHNDYEIDLGLDPSIKYLTWEQYYELVDKLKTARAKSESQEDKKFDKFLNESIDIVELKSRKLVKMR